jgi:hypothetical protein
MNDGFMVFIGLLIALFLVAVIGITNDIGFGHAQDEVIRDCKNYGYAQVREIKLVCQNGK